MAIAGWYQDPTNAQMLRYFDGANWTNDTQAMAQGGAPSVPSTPGASAFGGGATHPTPPTPPTPPMPPAPPVAMGPGGYNANMAGGYPNSGNSSAMAGWALGCSIAGLLTFFTAIVGVILGFVFLHGHKKVAGQRGRGMAISAIVIGLVIIVGTIGLLSSGVLQRQALNSANNSVAQATAQSVGNDAVAIAAIRDAVPNSSDVQTAVLEVQGATLKSVNGASPVNGSQSTAVTADIVASNGVCIMITFPNQVNGAVSTYPC